MGNILLKAGVHRNGTTLCKRIEMLTYADNIDIIGCAKRDVSAAFELESVFFGCERDYLP